MEENRIENGNFNEETFENHESESTGLTAKGVAALVVASTVAGVGIAKGVGFVGKKVLTPISDKILDTVDEAKERAENRKLEKEAKKEEKREARKKRRDEKKESKENK